MSITLSFIYLNLRLNQQSLYVYINPNKSFNPEKLGLPYPLPPIYYTALFSFRIQKSEKFFNFFAKNNGCYPNLLSNSHLEYAKYYLKEKCKLTHTYIHLVLLECFEQNLALTER